MSEIKHIQKTLTPIVLQEGMPGYSAVLDIEEKLNDKEVFNIAVTGPYGSGKSTVLKSLKTKFSDKHKFLTISLASLTGEKKTGPLDDEEQQKVEFSILQQLIYKEKPGTLPNSRFRRIRNRSVTHSVWFGLAIVAFIASFFVVFEPKLFRVETICNILNLGERWNLTFDIICSLYMLLCLFKLAAYLFRRSSFMSIKALSLKDVAIEINEDSSVFNKHLEEIVYFFESTGYDVVIIEDLDRFGCPEIFQKLREINFLLQQSEVLNDQSRKIKFIYAVKDDLFKDAERTKFFDYIVTVIPVVNPKNSCEKLTQELSERGYSIERDALLDLSEFVDDMRMLKNVVNEFQQYMDRLAQSSTPNKEKLLAMIIYKNHHPDDFDKLHYKDGAVYEFISKKPEWVKIAIEKVIEPKLQLWEKKKEELNEAQKFTLKQWRMLYMARYREHLSTTLTSINVQGQGRPITAIADSEDLFEDLIKQKRITFQYRNYNNNYSDTTDNPFGTVEKEVDEKIGYFERKKILNRPSGEIDNEILMVREEEKRLKNFKLAKLLVQFPEIKENEEFKKIPLSPLMIHFLQRGYIDETYYDYMTVFDGTVLSLNDRDLLSRIKQNSPQVSYEEPIDDVEAFVNEIPRFVYEYKSILNYRIADFLEEHPVIWKPALDLFESHFVDATMPPLDFLAQYYKEGHSGADKLWRKYVKSNSSWLRIQTYDKKEYWDILVEAWLKYCEPSNIDNTVLDWLNTNLGFCIERLKAIGVQHLKDIIADCLFVDVSSMGPIGDQYQGEDVMDVADYILENKLFELTDNNIFVACEVSGNPFNKSLRNDTVTMSDILSSNNNGFKEYVEENIRNVFIGYVSKCRGQEEETGLIYILNHEKLEEQEKIDYLRLQTHNKVLDITDINDSFKPLAVRGEVLFASWENVLAYYAYDQEIISEDLERFINDNVDLLLKKEYPTEDRTSFAGDIVYGGPYLKLSVYEKLLPIIIAHVNRDDESKLSKDTGIEHIKLLVNGNYLSEKPETASIVSLFGATIFAKYLSYHISGYITNYEDYGVDTKTLSILLDKDSSLTNGQRWNLVKKISGEVVSKDTELANVIMSIMLRRKEELSWPVVEATLRKANNKSNKMQFQERLLGKHYADPEKVVTIISTMASPYNEIVDDSKRPVVPKDFKKYLDLIKPLGLYTSYKEEKSGYRVYHSTK